MITSTCPARGCEAPIRTEFSVADDANVFYHEGLPVATLRSVGHFADPAAVVRIWLEQCHPDLGPMTDITKWDDVEFSEPGTMQHFRVPLR